MAQPKLKINELAESINSLTFARRKISETEGIRLRNLLGKLTTTRNAEYYDFLGRIACLENDRAKMITYYKNAISLSLFGNNYEIQENFLYSLNNLGLFFKAKEQLKIISEKFPTCAEVSKYIVKNRFALCRFREALSLAESLENKPANFHKAEEFVSIFDKADLSDDEAENLCKLAYSVLETKNLYYSGSEIEIIDNCVFYTIYVDAPIKEVAQIDFELSYLFAEQLENMYDDVIIFEYKSVETLKP
jgi:hypothetical protein